MNRYKTAISRTDFSRPVRMALTDGLIHDGVSVFDYGCGRGDDLRYLKLRGVPSKGWDPVHRREAEIASAHVVNLGYVVNVIEDSDERSHCLLRAWSLATRVLIVSARLTSETPELASVTEYGDGFVTSIPTFQKFYDQAEFKAWLEQHLPEPAVAAGPGVFYVFRDDADRIAFLASRYRRRGRDFLPSVESTIEDHKELLRPLIEFFEARGRAPAEDELPGGEEIRDRFGSLQRALRLVQRAHDAEAWRRVITARGEDLLIFLALARFDGRPRFGRLPLPVRRDVRAIFSSYRRACEEADVALLAVGEMERVLRSARSSKVGKLTPSAIYVHESALDSLPPLLRLFEGCARGYIGRVDGANLIKLHTGEPMVSYLSYPQFDSDPHPALAEGLTVHLQTFRVRERDYRGSRNPPILHRKETFVAADYPLHGKFSRLTRQEEAKGLYVEPSRIGTRRGWEEVLEAKELRLRGHRLLRARAAGSSVC